MESVVNFHNAMWMIKEANVEAFNNVEANLQSLLSQFSDAKNVDNMKAQYKQHFQLVMHSIIAFTVLATALFTGFGSVLSLGTAMAASALAPLGIEEEMVKDLNLLAAALRFNGAVTGGMGAVGSTTVQLTTDLLDGSNAAETIHTAAREAIAQNHS